MLAAHSYYLHIQEVSFLVKLPVQENIVPLSSRRGVECIMNSNLQQSLGFVLLEHASLFSTQHPQSEYGKLSKYTGVWLPGNKTHIRREDSNDNRPSKEHFKVAL